MWWSALKRLLADQDGQAMTEQALLVTFLMITIVVGDQVISRHFMPALRNYLDLFAVCLALPIG